MEDSNKNAKTEKQIEEQNDLNKVATGSIVINAPKVAPKRIRVSVKTKPAPTNLSEIAPKSIAEVIEPPKATKPAIKNVVLANSKEEQEKPDLGDDTKKVIKKKTKKAEEKVDKLKKKVKKAKKKDVKKSKLKGLKEKLGKALKKFKTIVEKLKVEDK